MSSSFSSEESEEDPYADSGSEYLPSDSPDVPGPSRGRKRQPKNLFNIETDSEKDESSVDNILKPLPGIKKKGKKRVRNKKNWKRNVLKNKKARGEEYINSAKKTIPRKTTGPNCECKRKCFTQISDVQKQNLLHQFYQIGDKTKQDIYLGGLMSVINVQRKRPTTGLGREKTNTYHFKIRIGSQETIVCKTAFYSLHGITKHRVSQIAKKLAQGNVIAPPDMRGQHLNRPNRIDEEIVTQIDEHIRSFPKRKSHYSREDNEKRYFLSPELNIAKMYRLYLEKYETEKYKLLEDGKSLKEIKPKVSYDFYNRQFNLNHNLSFGHPRSDTCQKCDKLSNLIAAEENAESRSLLVTEKQVHLQKADIFYKKLREYTNLAAEDDTVEVLSFDFQQNLPLPHIPSGDVFYKRQIWEFNFCIYSAQNKQGTFYMYDELTGKKGCNEVVSFLHHYLTNFLPETVTTLHLFSDNCFAQNKNQTIVQFLHTFVNTSNTNIQLIIHQFPEPGHSFLPCDRCFGIIEKEKRKKEIVYLPSEWRNLVKKTSKKFRVIEVNQDMILDFSNTFKPLFKKCISNQQKEKFTVSKYRLFKYEKKNIIQCSTTAGLEVYASFNIKKPNAVLVLPNSKLYNTFPLNINPKKIENVMSLADKYVPPVHMWYYEQVRVANNTGQYAEDHDSDGGEVEIELF